MQVQCYFKNMIIRGGQTVRLTAARELRKASGSVRQATCAGRAFHIEGAASMKVFLNAWVEVWGMKNLDGAPRVL